MPIPEKYKAAVRRSFPKLYGFYVQFIHHLKWWKCRGLIRETKENYKYVLQRITKKISAGQPVRVLFLISECSKWKCQALYDQFAQSPNFEPIIAFTQTDLEEGTPKEYLEGRFEQLRAFFGKRGSSFVEVYSVNEDNAVELSAFSPDVVFYSTYWLIPECQQPQVVSRYALTCFVPYFLACHDAAQLDAQRLVHLLVFRYFALDKTWVHYFKRKSWGCPYAGEFVGLGHPMLDMFAEAKREFSRDDLVIYAPHFSILDYGEQYSTFMETGRFMLDYAKSHPEISWCFKPHPHLRRILVKVARWTKEEVDAYYGEWEKIGIACYDADYPSLFMRSRALITDCSSFLMEYSAVNRPLIHLVRSDTKYKVAKPCRQLFESFYAVRDKKELETALKLVVEDFNDTKVRERDSVVNTLNLWHVKCSERIVSYLEEILGVADIKKSERLNKIGAGAISLNP